MKPHFLHVITKCPEYEVVYHSDFSTLLSTQLLCLQHEKLPLSAMCSGEVFVMLVLMNLSATRRQPSPS